MWFRWDKWVSRALLWRSWVTGELSPCSPFSWDGQGRGIWNTIRPLGLSLPFALAAAGLQRSARRSSLRFTLTQSTSHNIGTMYLRGTLVLWLVPEFMEWQIPLAWKFLVITDRKCWGCSLKAAENPIFLWLWLLLFCDFNEMPVVYV
jgi:hypothetical protein